MVPRHGFRFHAPDAHTTSRLEEAVGGRALPLDVVTLASRLLFAAPPVEGATPYVGVRASYDRSMELDELGGARARSPADAAVRLRQMLERAVAHALDGTARAAVLAGGGLDSAALLALAHRWGRENGVSVFAVALDFGGKGDDRPYLAALERHLGCEVLRVRPEDASGRIELFLRGVDAAPFTWPSGGMEVEALARARANGAEVVLTGVGAAELVDGEPRSLGRLALRAPRAALRSARVMRGFARPSSPVVAWVARPLLSALAPAAVHRWRSRRARTPLPLWAGPALRASLDAGHRSQERRSSTLETSMWALPHHEHLAWIRHQEDLAAGIECRQPFLEAHVRALVAEFEPSWLLEGGIRRGLFREAVRDLLPNVLLEREDKAGFEDGLRRFLMAAGGFDVLRPLVSVTELASLGLVDPRVLAEAFDAFERAPDDGEHWGNVWPVLAVEGFLRARSEAA